MITPYVRLTCQKTYYLKLQTRYGSSHPSLDKWSWPTQQCLCWKFIRGFHIMSNFWTITFKNLKTNKCYLEATSLIGQVNNQPLHAGITIHYEEGRLIYVTDCRRWFCGPLCGAEYKPALFLKVSLWQTQVISKYTFYLFEIKFLTTFVPMTNYYS